MNINAVTNLCLKVQENYKSIQRSLMTLYFSTSVSQVESLDFSGPSKTILISLSRVIELKQFHYFVAKRPRTEKPLSTLEVLCVMRSENLNNNINSGYSDPSFIRVLYTSDGAIG